MVVKEMEVMMHVDNLDVVMKMMVTRNTLLEETSLLIGSKRGPQRV